MHRKSVKVFLIITVAIILAISNMTSAISAVTPADLADGEGCDLVTCANTIRDVYKARYPGKDKMINEIIAEITASDVFKDCFECSGKAAFQIVEDSLNDALKSDNMPVSILSSNESYSVNVPVVNQLCYDSNGAELKTYCGPASALQALIGNGKLSNVDSNKSASKVYSVGQSMGTNNSGTNISKLNNYIQSYYSSTGTTYKVKAFTKYSYSKAINFVKYSLSNGAAPVIRIDDTSVLGYYNNNSYTHYVTISAVDTKNNTVTLVDPHYLSTYRGTHKITMEEFENLVNYDGWMCVYTNAGDGSYVYD